MSCFPHRVGCENLKFAKIEIFSNTLQFLVNKLNAKLKLQQIQVNLTYESNLRKRVVTVFL